MPTLEDVRATLNTWRQERLGGAPLAYHTEAYNQVVQALPDLEKRLGALFVLPEPAPETPPEPDQPTKTAAKPAADKE